MKNFKIAVIGLGARGNALFNTLTFLKRVKIVAVCDIYQDRVDTYSKRVEEKLGKAPKGYTSYKELIEKEKLDLVVVSTWWEQHINIAIDVMEKGIPVALEVGGAYSIEELWKLVYAYERTKTPITMLENCCYGRLELMALNMKEKGIFGEIVHCTGAYRHDCRRQIANGVELRHHRQRNFLYRSCDNYPTHDFGPIAKLLDINRGNRILTLTSVASKARGMNEYIKTRKPDDERLLNAHWKQGDVITTTITCAGGETVTLNLIDTLPTFYSRNFGIMGTRAALDEDTQAICIDDPKVAQAESRWSTNHNNIEKYRDELDLEHPKWKKFLEEGVTGGHGGMDVLMFVDVVESVEKKRPFYIDVYDIAVWMSITTLSEQSISLGGMPVPCPDFTNGAWTMRELIEK